MEKILGAMPKLAMEKAGDFLQVKHHTEANCRLHKLGVEARYLRMNNEAE
tara:strand:- start:8831 stop:8980 length:150 start_codon:yes stop_codon:yes gene_type:complete